MASLVIDASVAVKWVIEEDGSADAAALLGGGHALCAPDLLMPECANILWKKARRAEITADEAILAAELLQRAAIELVPMRPLMAAALRLAVELGHPAYDAAYLALSRDRGCPLVTADGQLARVVAEHGGPDLRHLVTVLARAGSP